MGSPADERAPAGVEIRDAYLRALLAADVAGARAIVESALQGGMTMQELYLSVFQEALYEVGRLWQTGAATVAQEHLATATTQALTARLWGGAPAPRGQERVAIVTATENDFHALGSRFLSDFLEAEGWTVIELGAATPTEALARLVEQVRPRLVCLSTTLAANLSHARETVAALRRLTPAPLIAVGGQAYRGSRLSAEAVEADLFAQDAVTFLESLRARLAEAPS